MIVLGAGGQFIHIHRPSTPCQSGCGETGNVAHGTLQGLIRIRTGDRFFKTVIVRRMSATVNDTPTPETSCPPPCVQPYYTLDASGPFRAGSPTVDIRHHLPEPPPGAFDPRNWPCTTQQPVPASA